jgi:hypothetical protein
MISPDEFKEIYDRVEAGEDLSNADAKSLIEAIVELDGSVILLQNAVVLAHGNTRVVVETLAESILARTGRTDKKTKKAIAKIAASALARYEISLQMFLSGALTDDVLTEEAFAESLANDAAAVADEDDDEAAE